ncbi:MAG: DUF2177 family protein [Ginsengibacter sp.]
MNTKNFFLGGIAGGAAFFLLGYLFYGTLFSDFFSKNAGSATGVARQMDQFVWWALILGNLLFGFLLSYVENKANIRTLGAGLVAGAILGILFAASYDFTSYGTSNLMTMKSVLADIVILGIMAAISGAIVGLVRGMMGKE